MLLNNLKRLQRNAKGRLSACFASDRHSKGFLQRSARLRCKISLTHGEVSHENLTGGGIVEGGQHCEREWRSRPGKSGVKIRLTYCYSNDWKFLIRDNKRWHVSCSFSKAIFGGLGRAEIVAGCVANRWQHRCFYISPWRRLSLPQTFFLEWLLPVK